MKTISTIAFLFCITIVAKSQQLPKFGNKSFSNKFKLEKIEPSNSILELGALKLGTLNKNWQGEESLLFNKNGFKNKFTQPLTKAEGTKYNMPIMDTKDENSRLLIFVPDSTFKSNMPILRSY